MKTRRKIWEEGDTTPGGQKVVRLEVTSLVCRLCGGKYGMVVLNNNVQYHQCQNKDCGAVHKASPISSPPPPPPIRTW